MNKEPKGRRYKLCPEKGRESRGIFPKEGSHLSSITLWDGYHSLAHGLPAPTLNTGIREASDGVWESVLPSQAWNSSEGVGNSHSDWKWQPALCKTSTRTLNQLPVKEHIHSPHINIMKEGLLLNDTRGFWLLPLAGNPESEDAPRLGTCCSFCLDHLNMDSSRKPSWWPSAVGTQSALCFLHLFDWSTLSIYHPGKH